MKYNPMLAMNSNPSIDKDPPIENSNSILSVTTTKTNMPIRAKPKNETRIAMVPAANRVVIRVIVRFSVLVSILTKL